MRDSTNGEDLVSGVIYFPVSYSETVVESFNTINIRANIESEGPKGAGDVLKRSGVGCDKPLDGMRKLSSELQGSQALMMLSTTSRQKI